MHLYQAYMRLEKDRVMPAIRTEYLEYMKTIPAGTKPEGQLRFQSNVARRMLQSELKDVQDRVERFRQDSVNFAQDGELSAEEQKTMRLAE